MTDTSVFDLHAAWMRRSQRDLKAFLEALAVRLETALPSQVHVERKSDSLFSKAKHVQRVTINTDVRRYMLENTGHDIRVSFEKVRQEPQA